MENKVLQASEQIFLDPEDIYSCHSIIQITYICTELLLNITVLTVWQQSSVLIGLIHYISHSYVQTDGQSMYSHDSTQTERTPFL